MNEVILTFIQDNFFIEMRFVVILMVMNHDTGAVKYFSRRLMCPTTGISYSDPAPNTFSFNSPQGACPRCKGLGYINEIDLGKVIPKRNMSIYEGAIVPLGKYKNQMIFWQIDAILKKYDCTLKTKIEDIPDDALNEILYGSLETVRIDKELVHTSSDYFVDFDGVVKYLHDVMENGESSNGQKWADQFLAECVCPDSTAVTIFWFNCSIDGTVLSPFRDSEFL